MGDYRGPLDNGEAFMRAVWRAEAAAQEQLRTRPEHWQTLYPLAPHLTPRAWTEPPMAGEPEPEDVTGLKLLDEFLQGRKRDGAGKRK